MQLILDPTKKPEVTTGYRMLAALVGDAKTPAAIVKTACEKLPKKKTETPEPKKDSAPQKEPEPAVIITTDVPDEPKVTQESLIDYIKHNFADNIQPVKDMLDRMGAPKVSEIPEDQLEAAMGLLKEG